MRSSALWIAALALLASLAGPATASTVLFLDRCPSGCTYTPGMDDARTNTSSIVNQTSTLSAFPYGDPSWTAVVDCVQQTFAPFDVQVTDVDPGSAEHFEVAVAGTSQELGLPAGIGNDSPFTCDVVPNGLAFAFAGVYGDVPLEICWSAAQAAGSLFGLDHEYLAGDVMTYLSGSLPKAFLDADASCGEFTTRACQCGGATQNSYQRLLAALPEPDATASAGAAALALAGCARRRARAA